MTKIQSSPGEQREGEAGGPESVTTPESGSPGLMRKLRKKSVIRQMIMKFNSKKSLSLYLTNPNICVLRNLRCQANARQWAMALVKPRGIVS